MDLEIPENLSQETKSRIKNEVGEYLVEQILLNVGESKSPLDGARFKALSKNYRKEKQEEGAPGVPNLELHGDMLSSLSYVEKGGGIEIGVFGSEAPKADGHNNFSGKSNLPERRFLPAEGESFKSSIEKEVQAIIDDAVAEDEPIDETAFEEIDSNGAFYTVLMSELGVTTRSEARNVVLRTPKWFNFVQKAGLMEFL